MIVKICGLSTPETMDAALEAGADMVGLVFHPKSPRFVSMPQAVALAERARGKAEITALIVDYDPMAAQLLCARIKPDWLQLHGSETIADIAAIRTASDRRVMKAVGVSTAADLAPASRFAAISDLLLVDAKPPKDAAYPGGHGMPFDWRVLIALDPGIPFMLSGGLTPDTVAQAIAEVRKLGVNLRGVDVSSGVETAPGVKDVARIKAFVAAARSAE